MPPHWHATLHVYVAAFAEKPPPCVSAMKGLPTLVERPLSKDSSPAARGRCPSVWPRHNTGMDSDAAAVHTIPEAEIVKEQKNIIIGCFLIGMYSVLRDREPMKKCDVASILSANINTMIWKLRWETYAANVRV